MQDGFGGSAQVEVGWAAFEGESASAPEPTAVSGANDETWDAFQGGSPLAPPVTSSDDPFQTSKPLSPNLPLLLSSHHSTSCTQRSRTFVPSVLHCAELIAQAKTAGLHLWRSYLQVTAFSVPLQGFLNPH